MSLPASCTSAVIATHGWIDNAKHDIPMDVAREIRKRTDPNEWACFIFDWRGGASVINPKDSAKYGRDIAGPSLAKALLTVMPNVEHVHLIGFSSGCWVIDSAANKIAAESDATIHLTFLDAYMPSSWKNAEIGSICSRSEDYWAEHYFTKDYTFKATQKKLKFAHNVDITAIDPGLNEHRFPYRWYYATISGSYAHRRSEKKHEVITRNGTIEYGYARSVEAGKKNWFDSLSLKPGNSAVKLDSNN